MHISSAALILMLAVSGPVFGQAAPAAAPPPAVGAAPQAGPSQGAGAPGAAPAPVNTVSSLLKPSLTTVQDTLNSLRIDKWKKGSVRDEAGDHVGSLLKDLQTNLPPLIAAADSAPSSVSLAIPLTKHLDAVYAVLLRVEEAARVSAPGDQVPPLQQALLQLNQARLALDNQLEVQAVSQEKQLADLQAALRTQQQALAQARAAAAVTPPPCKPPAPAKKRPAAKKPAPATSPAAKPPAGQQPGQTQTQKPQAQKPPASGQKTP